MILRRIRQYNYQIASLAIEKLEGIAGSIKRLWPDWDTKEDVNSDNSAHNCTGVGLVSLASSDDSQTVTNSVQRTVTEDCMREQREGEWLIKKLVLVVKNEQMGIIILIGT